MISRRNIRVKVMQTLYTLSSLENDITKEKPQKILDQHFNQTRSLLIYLTWFLTEISRYAETDAKQRSSKHLPTTDDLNVNTKLAGNELLWKMLEDAGLQEQFSNVKPIQVYNQSKDSSNDLIRKIYLQLTETSEYKTYISQTYRNKAGEKSILEFILNDLMLASEIFVSHVEENFANWDDDGELVVQLLIAFMQKPSGIDLNQLLSPDKEEFARNLLRTVLEKGEYLQSFITPKLKNWDPERIALLDMIIMKMGVAEFLYFETIPPKVTINEYIDLAKEYSTQQSGQFVNGILDNIHKELVQQGILQKVEYKKGTYR